MQHVVFIRYYADDHVVFIRYYADEHLGRSYLLTFVNNCAFNFTPKQ